MIELFNSVGHTVSEAADYQLTTQLAQLRATYTTMLHYMVQGTDDPNAAAIRQNIIRDVYALGDRASRIIRISRQTSDKYVTTLRSLRGDTDTENIIRQLLATDSTAPHEELLLRLFAAIWTSDEWTRSDYETVQEALDTATVSADDKCIIVAATMMALTEMFDERKMLLLIDAYLQPQAEINQRALVAIILIIRQYDRHISHFPELKARLKLICDNPKFVSDSMRVMMQLEYSRLTDEVSERMRSDIIPTILKSRNFRQTKYGIEEIDSYLTQNGENPEWIHSRKDDEAAQEKIHEMAEMQMEGADVYMASFSHMKQHSFFQQTAHWFYPFFTLQSEVRSVVDSLDSDTAALFSTLMTNAPFCDSDRYSFTFMLGMMGSEAQTAMSKTLMSGISRDELSELMENKQQRSPADISRSFIFDLYRFHRLYPYHLQFHNPFDTKGQTITPLSTAALHPLLEHKQEVLNLAQFMMRKGQYAAAIDLYMHTQPQQLEADIDTWQQIGFCQQKLGRLDEAYQSYTTAYRLNSNSQWTLRQLAAMAFQSGHYIEAEAYYDLLIDSDPDNIHLLKRKVGCLMNQDLYSDAIEVLHKLLYIDEASDENKNNMAWCRLMTGQIDTARQLYAKQLDAHPDQTSLSVNLALTYLAEGNIADAYPLLRTAYQLHQQTNKSIGRFLIQLRQAFEAIRNLNEFAFVNSQSIIDAVREGV